MAAEKLSIRLDRPIENLDPELFEQMREEYLQEAVDQSKRMRRQLRFNSEPVIAVNLVENYEIFRAQSLLGIPVNAKTTDALADALDAVLPVSLDEVVYQDILPLRIVKISDKQHELYAGCSERFYEERQICLRAIDRLFKVDRRQHQALWYEQRRPGVLIAWSNHVMAERTLTDVQDWLVRSPLFPAEMRASSTEINTWDTEESATEPPPQK